MPEPRVSSMRTTGHHPKLCRIPNG
jgi:hypothetical protein